MSEQKSLQLYIRSGAVQSSIESTIKDRAGDFTTSLLTVVNSNALLQECDPQEVVRTALKAASMRLPIDPNLGLAYIIPYNNSVNVGGKWVKKFEPQLQIGWRGYIQLALRTRQYKTINVSDVRQGEYVGTNRLTGGIDFNWEADSIKRVKLPIAGYVGFFELHDGFTKTMYMSIEELEAHAKKYSKSYAKGNGPWKDNKPQMFMKTVLKLLVSKYGPQSTELQQAFRADQAGVGGDDEGDDHKYVDNDKDTDQTPAAPGEAEAPQQHPKDDVVEGEVVDPPADTAPAPAAAPEPQAQAQEPPKDTRSVKERADDFVAKGKAQNAANRHDQTTIDEAPSDDTQH